MTTFEEQFPSIRQSDFRMTLLSKSPLTKDFMQHHFLDKQRVRNAIDAVEQFYLDRQSNMRKINPNHGVLYEQTNAQSIQAVQLVKLLFQKELGL